MNDIDMLLVDCFRFFAHRDLMDAAGDSRPVRYYSPLTVRIAAALTFVDRGGNVRSKPLPGGILNAPQVQAMLDDVLADAVLPR